MYPVDVLRALKMASAGGREVFSLADFIKTHGIKGLASQGALAEITKSSLMRVSKFFFFPLSCQFVWGRGSKDLSPLQKGIAGALATAPEILMITPLELAKLGLQTDSKKEFGNSSSKMLRHIYHTRGGVGALWSGWTGLQFRNGLWTGTYFATLSSFRDAIEPRVVSMGLPQTVAQFTAGFCAGTFAACFNTPADVVRSVVQRRMISEPNRIGYGISPKGAAEHFQVLKSLIREQGVSKGLFPGFGFKALHLGGSGALMALFVPIFSNMLGIKYGAV